MDAGGSVEAAEGCSRSYFGRGKGMVATGIRQVWREQERVRGGDHRHQRLGARQVTLVYWDRYRLRPGGRMILCIYRTEFGGGGAGEGGV